jgi:[calcium/calmodulin-dependent protein kinase] kinase
MLQASDIWSMGVTLYAFVYGQVPFRDDNVMALYSKIQNEPVVFQERPPICEELQDLINRMLHKDPSQRLTLPEVKVSEEKEEDDYHDHHRHCHYQF